MLGLSLEQLNSFSRLTPWAVVIASIVGSGHCVGMCGGLVVASCESRSDHLKYHLGRLVGYFGLGILAGWLGQELLKKIQAPLFWISTFFITSIFIWMGIRILRASFSTQTSTARLSFHLWMPSARFMRFMQSASRQSAATLGLLTAFLPCGWLHLYVVAAVLSQSRMTGALILFAFWLGTVPALLVSSGIVRSGLLQSLSRNTSRRAVGLRLAGFLFIAAGILNVTVKIMTWRDHLNHPQGMNSGQKGTELICDH